MLVYTYGGAYTFGSADSTSGIPALVANETGLRVIPINYTVAPFSKWNQTTNEVISVIQALIELSKWKKNFWSVLMSYVKPTVTAQTVYQSILILNHLT